MSKRVAVEPPEYLKKLNVHHISMAQGYEALQWLESNDFNYSLFNIKTDTMVEVSWGTWDYDTDKLLGVADFAQWSFGPSIPCCIANCLSNLDSFWSYKDLKLDKQLLDATIKKLRKHG